MICVQSCPECGCCCDYGKECCAECRGGNIDHLGERGGCKRIDARDIPAELRIGPCRIGGRFFCISECRMNSVNKKPAGVGAPAGCKG